MPAGRAWRSSPSCSSWSPRRSPRFYSWRLIFLTFHGAPRAPKEVMDHAHESPQVMLVPLYILAAGAIFAGLIFAGYFVGEGLAEFWRGSVVVDEHLIEEMHHTSFWIAALPTIAMLARLRRRLVRFYIQQPETPGAARRGASGALPLPSEQVVL